MASTERLGEKHLASSTVSLAADQGTGGYHGVAVTIGSAGLPDVDILTSDTGFLYGVLMQDLDAGDEGAACELGNTLVRSGATYSLGVELTINGAGEFIAATSGDRVFGLALEAATAADTLYLARLVPFGPIKA